MRQVISNINGASDELGTSCPIFIDLKGMLIRTLVQNKPIQLVPGEAIHICDDPALAGKYDNLFVIDSPGFAAKLRAGDKITFNYGTIEMCVESFIDREDFF